MERTIRPLTGLGSPVTTLEVVGLTMTASLLHYRGWQGQFHGPWFGVWPIARIALSILLRRRLFWVLYACSLFLFLMFFMGNFLLYWIQSQAGNLPAGRMTDGLLQVVKQGLSILNGSRDTFSYFFSYQGTMVVVTLALAGSVMVGNDFTQRSLAFYLSKPIRRWHYWLGKCLAVGVVVNLLTTLPALLLFVQHGLDDYNYFTNPNFFREAGVAASLASWPLLLGILAYGLILTSFLSIFLVSVVTAVQRTVPLVMVWVSLFLFLQEVAKLLVDVIKWNAAWRLLDLWNDLSLLGRACLGYQHSDLTHTFPQPSFLEASLTLAGVTTLCLIYLHLRTRAVDIIS